jgi:hypothetical protein
VHCQQTLTVMHLHPFLSLALFIIFMIDFSSANLSDYPKSSPRNVACYHCSICSFRIICKKKCDCLFLVSLIKDLSMFACCNMISFYIFAVHGTFNTFLRNHISVASSCLVHSCLLPKSHFDSGIICNNNFKDSD